MRGADLACENEHDKVVKDLEAYDILSSRAVLMELYESTNGEEWKKNDHWGSQMPLSSWYRVQCDTEGNVVGLNFTANDLEGSYS